MPSTAAADIRRLIYGGSGSSGSLSTGDLEWFRTNHPNLYLAAAAAADAESASYKGLASKQVGDLRLEYHSLSDGYGGLADRLRSQGVRAVSPYAGGISVAGKDADNADSDMVAAKFRTDQFTNPNSSSTGYY